MNIIAALIGVFFLLFYPVNITRYFLEKSKYKEKADTITKIIAILLGVSLLFVLYTIPKSSSRTNISSNNSNTSNHSHQSNKEEAKIKEKKQTTCVLRNSFSGCCSNNGGMKKDKNGNYVFNDKGFAVCNNGDASPTCNKCE